MLVSLAVLLLIVGSSVWIAALNRERLDSVLQAEAVQNQLATVRTALENAETGQRGYLLTGRESYLAPYTSAVAALPNALATLRLGLDDTPAHAAWLAELKATTDDKLTELASTIALYRAGDIEAARALVLSDRGQLAMDRLRALLTAMGAEQRDAVRRQSEANNAGNRSLVVIDSAGFAVVVLLVVLVGLGVRRSVAQLRQAQAALTEANAQLAGMNDTLEATVARRTADLQEANDEIQRFAYIVSHDLRAPLVNIMGFTGELEVAAKSLRRFTDTLPEGLPEDVRAAAHEDLPEAIHFIKASTSKMDRLISAILKLSREGQRRLTPEPLAMPAILGGIVDSLRHQTRAGDVEIVIEGMPDLTADRLTIEQIFGNLIDNAVKYMQPGRPGRIVLRGREGQRVVRYEIEDNGRGIAERDRQRVFELFRRAGDQSVPGEGIGLAHVRALVRRLGGRIECESTPQVGSVFRITLPLGTDA